MPTLEDLIARVPPHMQWLARSDESKGFFVQIFTQEYVDTGGRSGVSAGVFGADLIQAFMTALNSLGLYP